MLTFYYYIIITNFYGLYAIQSSESSKHCNMVVADIIEFN